MKTLNLHVDYIKFKPLKKALKSIEELSEKDKKEKEIKEALVVLTAVEKGDSNISEICKTFDIDQKETIVGFYVIGNSCSGMKNLYSFFKLREKCINWMDNKPKNKAFTRRDKIINTIRIAKLLFIDNNNNKINTPIFILISYT